MISINEFLIKKHQTSNIKEIKDVTDIQPGDYFAIDWELHPNNKQILTRYAYGKCEQVNDMDDIDMFFRITERYEGGKPQYKDGEDGWRIYGNDFIGLGKTKKLRSVTDEEYSILSKIDEYLIEHKLQNNIPDIIGRIDHNKKITFKQ